MLMKTQIPVGHARSAVIGARLDPLRRHPSQAASLFFSLILLLSAHYPLQAALIPANSKVLFLGNGAATCQTCFAGLYAGDASVAAQNVTSAAFNITASVLNDFYNGRSSVTVKNSLMTELDKGYNYIVFVDLLDYAQNKPELHMESARILKSYTRSMGTQVVLPMLWASSNAVANTSTFENQTYRISDALGLACVPAGLTWKSIRNDGSLGSAECSPNAPNTQAAYALSATLFAHFFEKKPTGTFTNGLNASVITGINNYSYAAWETARTATHYTGTFTGGAFTPWTVPHALGSRNWADTGTSSEEATDNQLNTIITRAGYAYKGYHIDGYSKNYYPFCFSNTDVQNLANQKDWDFLFGRSNSGNSTAIADIATQHTYDPGQDSRFIVLPRHISNDPITTIQNTAVTSEYAVTYAQSSVFVDTIPNYIGIARAWLERPDLVFVQTWDQHMSTAGYMMQAAMIYTLVTGGQNPLSSYSGWSPDETYAILLGYKTVKELGGLTHVATPPIAYGANVTSISGAPITINLSGIDLDGLTVSAINVSSPSRGTLSVTGNTAIYTPNPGAVGRDTFTYQVNNGASLSQVATVTINNITQHTWAFETVSGGTTPDEICGNTATLVDNAATGATAPTPVAGKIGQALRFNGTSQYLTTAISIPGPNVFTVGAWFRTSVAGGKIIGFGNGSSYDRHLYINTSGQLVFGVNPGSVKTLTTSATIIDGAWHHVAASLSSAGMKLYLDGVMVGSDASTTSGQAYTGNWRIAYDMVNGWPGVGSGYLNGALDDVRVYYRALSDNEVSALMVPPTMTLTSLSPATGPSTGGIPVTITGTNLTGALAVTFGGVAATSVTAVSPTSVTCVAPVAMAPGTVSVNVSTATGMTTLSNGYTYVLPENVWPFETVGTRTTPDVLSGNTASLVNAPTQVAGRLGQALNFNGTSQYLTTANSMTSPDLFTLSAWVRTSTAGGKIIGFGNGSSYDRHLYINTSGKVVFGVYPGAVKTLTTSAAINNGAWHHVAASLSASGMKLYLDGAMVANDPTVTSGQAYSGNWRIGYDTLGTWPGAGSAYVNGDLDDVRVYYRELSQSEVTALAAPATPTLTSLSATSGPTAGGTPVILTGTNLTGATAVTFGGTAATSVTPVSATSVVCLPPAKTAGAVTVAVTTPGGTATLTNGYTYILAPTLTSLSPTSGLLTGGTPVILTGTNLTGVTTVTFGVTPATSVTAVSATSVSCVTPANAAGVATVFLTTPGGTAALTNGYTYMAAPAITTQPSHVSLIVGQAATFTVVATGTPTPTYQWQKNGADIAGATSASYTTPATVAGDSGSTYRCVVTNPSATVTTSSAMLTVSVALSRTGWVATALNNNAYAYNAIDGNGSSRWDTGWVQYSGQWFQVDMRSNQTFNQIVLDATASSGDYPRGYQVQVSNDGTNWGSALASGAGAAMTTIFLPTQNARYIRIVQTGTTTFNYWSIHELNVYNPAAIAPAITTQPSTITVTAGQTATFTVAATGSPAPTYQWQKGTTNISGATSASYTTPATVMGDNGSNYQCVVTNSAGTVTSIAATLTVYSNYNAWLLGYSLTGANALATADPDGDGVVNLIEYALGLSPVTTNINPVTLDQVVVNGSTYLRLSVNRNPAVTDVLIEGLSAGTLTNPAEWSTSTTVIETNTASVFTVRDSVPIKTTGKRFIRLRFTQ